jgi:hypothetical protein
LLTALGALCLAIAAADAATPSRPPATRLVESLGKIVPIPASVPHEPGDMIDKRLVPDLRYLAQHFPIYVTDGYSGPLAGGGYAGCHRCHVAHSDHYNGLAVDIVPARWSSSCDRNWRGITRLAHWAEPVQNRPNPPFRWVGYDGDAGHGCGNHLHLSWNHATAPEYRVASWVEVFRVGAAVPTSSGGSRSTGKHPQPSQPQPPIPAGPSGGVASSGANGGVGAGD